MLTAARIVPLLTSTIGAASFMSLGALNPSHPNSYLEVYAISADGTTVVGESGPDPRPFVWTAAEGLQALPLPEGASMGTASGVSSDGAIVVGAAIPAMSTEYKPIRWVGGVPEEIGPLPMNAVAGRALVISDDGTTILGTLTAPDPGPSSVVWVWRADTGFRILDQAFLGFMPVTPHAASSDGTVVVGLAWNYAFALGWAFRWSESTGIQFLGNAPTSNPGSRATCVSADGEVVWRWPEFRWQAGSSTTIGIAATDNSASGDVVGMLAYQVGSPPLEVPPFYWTPSIGAIDLRLKLTFEYGLTQVCGWQLGGSPRISDDGQTIVGYGKDPCGKTRGWVARLSGPPLPVPQPPCPGDTNGDGMVNGADLSVLLSRFGLDACGCGEVTAPDLNGDARVNGADLSVLLANFGEVCS